jgi:tRNA-dihydrouridine synthase C
MEGVTDPTFRSLVLSRNPPAALGGAFTEFVRVVGDRPVPAHVLQRHLGSERFAAPVGLQLMGNDAGAVAESAARAAASGAPLVDLNFGCPAKGALKGCAGSALLRDPTRMEALVRACVEAVDGAVPVSAKIRAGYDDDRDVETLARAVEAGGAAMLSVHARTRAEGYAAAADWGRIARAAASVAIPVCGNGGLEVHADLERMRRETGCALGMVGRGALGNPWIFSGRTVGAREAVLFLFEYVARMRAGGSSTGGAAARVKELLRHWTAGALVRDETDRTALLRTRPHELLEELRSRGSLGSDEIGELAQDVDSQALELSGEARELGLFLG